ncbi:hypothetical protein K504DRAFT_379791 [Pleomassaria siparia CBS 279.74]|uniref:DUF3431 domain-containing protein n=1 Tax=Pleomassaria siparia CBS 279.74 TaxID=1314801 RepID=A0A6G1KAY5_9PLEO|nr:hypothetical protein K504DRAFT_379791 [Pleomassaria siparia CBS 279.74]
MIKRNLVPFLTLSFILFFAFFLYSSTAVHKTLSGIPQKVGLGEHVGDDTPGADVPAGGKQQHDPNYANWNPKANFQKGSPMPPGHNYTSILVIAKTKDEDIGWMDGEIPNQPKAVYVADDPTAPLHPPKNKGHEVMIYLSWIIDNYDNLPDVAIFMHAHQYTWHNDDILGNNAGELIKRLSRQRVWREGFVNMRCSWYPGCPDWMHPGETEENVFKQEEVLLAKSWSELFPLDEVPAVLAQPCCAQMALSRERIQAKPLTQYVWYRDWLFSTKLPDFLSGRIWEYIWQFVFTGESVWCPKEHVCFCDQFGSCFGGENEFNEFIDRKNEFSDRERDLREWKDKGKAIEDAKKEGRFEEAAQLDVPEKGLDEKLKKEIERLRSIVDGLKDEARKRGDDPKNRAFEAGREWKEGDDF